MTIDRTLRKAFLQPGSVALVGATPDLKKVNSRPQRFLERFGYKGAVYPINPSRDQIFGLRAYPDLKAVPGAIDHAFIMVPAAAVPAVIDVSDAEINPLIVKEEGQGVVAVDGLAVF